MVGITGGPLRLRVYPFLTQPTSGRGRGTQAQLLGFLVSTASQHHHCFHEGPCALSCPNSMTLRILASHVGLDLFPLFLGTFMAHPSHLATRLGVWAKQGERVEPRELQIKGASPALKLL